MYAQRCVREGAPKGKARQKGRRAAGRVRGSRAGGDVASPAAPGQRLETRLIRHNSVLASGWSGSTRAVLRLEGMLADERYLTLLQSRAGFPYFRVICGNLLHPSRERHLTLSESGRYANRARNIRNSPTALIVCVRVRACQVREPGAQHPQLARGQPRPQLPARRLPAQARAHARARCARARARVAPCSPPCSLASRIPDHVPDRTPD